MKAAVKATEATREFLVFVLGTEHYGVDILKVQEIRGYERVTPIPAAPAFLKGVVNLRGVIVPLIDMRVRFGLADPRYDATTVVVVLRLAGRVVGLVVDGVSDVVRLAAGDIKPPPPLGSLVDASYLAGLAAEGERMILLLEVEKLLASGELTLVAAAAESAGNAA